MTAVDDGGLQGEENWQQWVVTVAVYGGGLQGEKTLFFTFILSLHVSQRMCPSLH